MSLLNTVNTDETIQEEVDTLGGAAVLESGLYDHTVTMAYLNKSSGGALGLHLTLKDANGQEMRQTLWVTSGDSKGNKTYYERNGERHGLPGYLLADSLCLLTVGKEFLKMDTEVKTVGIWNPEVRAEVPTQVEVLMDLLGKEIITGVIKQTVDRNVKDASGNYVPSGETREENEIDKFFRAKDRKTTAEIRAQTEDAIFINNWDQRWTGNVRNRASGVAGNGATRGAPSAAVAAARNTGKPAQSLFG